MNFIFECSRSAAQKVKPKRKLQAERILQAATACFVRSGLQGASMQEICREAGMSPGALYRYFPSKDAIIDAIVAELRKRDAEILAKMADCDDVLEGIVKAFFNHLRTIDRTGLRPLFIEIRAEAIRNASVAEACRLSEEDARERFAAYLRNAENAGRIDPVVPVDALVTLLLSVGEGLIMNDLRGHGLSRETVEKVLRSTISAVIRPVPATVAVSMDT